MKLEDLAVKVIEAAEASGAEFMAVGAIAAGAYGVPRSTRDVDLLVGLNVGGGINGVIAKLLPDVEFDPQVVFDTLTWGRRHVGRSLTAHAEPRDSRPFHVACPQALWESARLIG